jgi:galactokinase/mevalonate kinase-like predicted kinase
MLFLFLELNKEKERLNIKSTIQIYITYHVIILSGQHSKTSTDIQKEQPRNHSVSDHNKGESNMEETLSRAGFSSYPSQV